MNIDIKLEQYGWNEEWNGKWTDKLRLLDDREYAPGRVAGDFGSKYKVITAAGEMWGELSGKFRHSLSGSGEYPAVGDWVILAMQDGGAHAVIHGVLPRHSVISRKVAGPTQEEQIVASNVDTLFLVSALNDDFNVRRMERYLIMAWNSGANPVILLTKADLCTDAELKMAEMQQAAPGVPVHAVSALLNDGREELQPYIGSGQTVALTGSSGCGKSTMVNWLSGRNLQLTQDVREGDGADVIRPHTASCSSSRMAESSSILRECASCSCGRMTADWIWRSVRSARLRQNAASVTVLIHGRKAAPCLRLPPAVCWTGSGCRITTRHRRSCNSRTARKRDRSARQPPPPPKAPRPVPRATAGSGCWTNIERR